MDFDLSQKYPDMSSTLNADDVDRIRLATGDAALLSWVKLSKKVKPYKPGVFESQLELMYGGLYARGLCNKTALQACKDEWNRIEPTEEPIDAVKELILDNVECFKNAVKKTPVGSIDDLVKLCGRIISDQMEIIAIGKNIV